MLPPGFSDARAAYAYLKLVGARVQVFMLSGSVIEGVLDSVKMNPTQFLLAHAHVKEGDSPETVPSGVSIDSADATIIKGSSVLQVRRLWC